MASSRPGTSKGTMHSERGFQPKVPLLLIDQKKSLIALLAHGQHGTRARNFEPFGQEKLSTGAQSRDPSRRKDWHLRSRYCFPAQCPHAFCPQTLLGSRHKAEPVSPNTSRACQLHRQHLRASRGKDRRTYKARLPSRSSRRQQIGSHKSCRN